jgi:hypothetical protein
MGGKMAVELFENKSENYYLIRDGESTLKLSVDDFAFMRQNGKSPILAKLWQSAKSERQKESR